MALTKTFLAGFHDDGSATNWSTVGFNSTGYEYLVVGCKYEGSATTVTVSDNKGTVFANNAQANHANGDLNACMSYGTIGTPGASHVVTVTLGGARSFKDMAVWGVHSSTASVISQDVHSEATGTGSTGDAGSLPTTTATASFHFAGGYTVQTGTAGSGWTEDYDAQNNYGQSRTDSSGTLDPAFTWTGSDAFVAVAGSFREGVASTPSQGDRKRPGPGVSPAKQFQFQAAIRSAYPFSTGPVTVALTGSAVTVSAGTLVASVQYYGRSLVPGPGISPDYTKVFRNRRLSTDSVLTTSVALSGQSMTASAGTLTPANAVPMSGQAATASAGTIIPASAIALSGAAATSSAGTLLPVLSISLAGSAVTISAGTLSVVIGQSAALTGSAVTSSAGTLVPTLSIALTGQAVTVTAGTLDPDGGETLVITTPRRRQVISNHERREILQPSQRRRTIH